MRDYAIELGHLLRSKTDGLERLATALGLPWKGVKQVWFRNVKTRFALEKARREWKYHLAKRVSEKLDKDAEKGWTDVAFDDCSCQTGIDVQVQATCPVHRQGARLCGDVWRGHICSRVSGHEHSHRSARGMTWWGSVKRSA